MKKFILAAALLVSGMFMTQSASAQSVSASVTVTPVQYACGYNYPCAPRRCVNAYGYVVPCGYVAPPVVVAPPVIVGPRIYVGPRIGIYGGYRGGYGYRRYR